MAGHSKWANIKHRKGRQDAKRAKVFTKIIRELTVAARDGGANADDNPALRPVLEKARAAQMPKETIERAIARGAGGQEGSDLAALAYEGYGPGGVAIYIETMTDNRNRTVAELRHAFAKAGGNLGTEGSVAYLFSKKGLIRLAPGADEEAVMEAALAAGAEDVAMDDDGGMEVTTPPESWQQVQEALAAGGMIPVASEVAMVPASSAALDLETGEKALRLLEALEDLDDVTSVYVNADFPEELLE